MRRKLRKIREIVPAKVSEVASSMDPRSSQTPEPPKEVPRITDEMVAAHREEVLKGARKYIYPLQHSKHRIVLLTTGIVIAAILAFLVYCTLGLYKYYQYNTFLYRITQVIPFPIAKTGKTFISYEDFLFEMRHYVHYYQTQQQQNFANPENRQQLLQFRKQALNDVINQSYIKNLAAQNNISVSDKEVDDRINMVRSQNRLGSNNKVLADVLRDYWGWSIADFKRSLKEQILAEKVTAAMDKTTSRRAVDVLKNIKLAHADFTEQAKKFSDDPAAKNNGGDFGFAIDKANANVPPQIIDGLFKLKPGQVSGIVNTGTTLEILKVITNNSKSVTAQHIVFKLQDLSGPINELKAKQPVRTYVNF